MEIKVEKGHRSFYFEGERQLLGTFAHKCFTVETFQMNLKRFEIWEEQWRRVDSIPTDFLVSSRETEEIFGDFSVSIAVVDIHSRA